MSAAEFTIYIQCVDGKSTPIHNVTEDMSLGELKAKIKEKVGMVEIQQKLVKDGKELLDNCESTSGG